MSYTITKKGTVTIPVRIRKKYNLKKGSKVRFEDTTMELCLFPSFLLRN
jgi:AbrB family looped-hinge helix DNA binding protein